MTREPLQGNEDPKNWQNLKVFILGWTKRASCGQVTELCGELKEGKSYFNKICCTEFSRSQLVIVDDKNVTFLLVDRKDIFHMWVYLLFSEKKWGRPESHFCTCWFLFFFLKCLWFKITFISKRHILEWILWVPSIWPPIILSFLSGPPPKGELLFLSGLRTLPLLLAVNSRHKIQAWPIPTTGPGMTDLSQLECFFGAHAWMDTRQENACIFSRTDTLICYKEERGRRRLCPQGFWEATPPH